MAYRNHYSGSPWQQGGPPFGVSGYGQNYGQYNDQYSMMNTNYGGHRNQSNYGGMYGSGGGGSGGLGPMRNLGYGGPSPSRYGGDRMGGSRQMMSRGQMQRKRLPQRSPAGGPRSKRPNLSSSSERRLSTSKPRRRRDSRGGSKGRSREHSEDDACEDDTYNPAEPTEDVSDVECDGYQSWQCSSDEETVEAEPVKEESKENGTDKKLEEENSTPKKFICYVCKVTCSKENKYRKHQASKDHTSKIDELLAVRREKKQTTSADEDKAGSEKDSKRKTSRKPGNWCTVCETAFGGNFLTHRRTKEHRKKRDKKYPKCRPCRMGFSSIEEYRNHYKTEEHKFLSAEFHYLKGLLSGSDEDEDVLQPAKVESEDEEKMEAEDVKVKIESEIDDSKEEKKEGGEEEDDSTESKDDTAATKSPEVKKTKPKEPKAQGQSFIVSVQGYYCKLCRKFFKDVSIAKSKHCRSTMHTDAFKAAMEEALKQEEERQKLADEQDKLDQKAAEKAELAAEIAAIERSAKEAAKREAKKKSNVTTASEDVEMKDVADKEPAAVEEKPSTDKPAVAAVAAATTTATEGEEEPKVEENGVKESEPSEKTDKPAEVQEESTEGDDGEEEEPEKEVATKEEVTSSPATRRGRGRGRGRKRR